MIKKYLATLSLLVFALGANTLYAQELFSMGLPDEPDLYYDSIPIQVPMTNSTYRSLSSSASVKKYAPTPRSQGQYGTCAAWATAYAARTILEAHRLGVTDKKAIDSLIYSYGFLFRTADMDLTCDGAHTSKLVANMQTIGLPRLKDYNIHCPPASMPQNIYTLAAKHKIEGFVRLWDENYNKTYKQRIQAVKMSLYNNKPVVISMICPRSFHAVVGYDLWTPLNSDNPTNGAHSNRHGRHAMCVVSYDDEKYGGAFEIQNSWGAGWGKGGYTWISYEDFATYVYQAYELQTFATAKNEYSTLGGAFNLIVDNGQAMIPILQNDGTFKIDRAFRSGTRFRMYIDNNEPAYVYAFGIDGTNKTFQIFPYAEDISPLINYKSSQVAIPSEEKHVRMDNTVGMDYFCVLYSKEALDLEQIQKAIKLQNKNLSIQQKIENVLGNKLIKNPNLKVGANGKMTFSTTTKQNASVVAIITALEHIN